LWRVFVHYMGMVVLTLLWFVQGNKDDFLLYIYKVSVFLLLVGGGGEILIWGVKHFCECLYLCCVGLHLCKRRSIMNSVCPISSCIRISFVLAFKLWKDNVYYCRIDEIDVFILIFVLIRFIHVMSCAGAMMWMSCGVDW
jgi:hypothetical protein